MLVNVLSLIINAGRFSVILWPSGGPYAYDDVLKKAKLGHFYNLDNLAKLSHRPMKQMTNLNNFRYYVKSNDRQCVPKPQYVY